MLREVSFYSVCMPERAGLGFQSSGRSFLAGRILLVCTKGAYTGRIFRLLQPGFAFHICFVMDKLTLYKNTHRMEQRERAANSVHPGEHCPEKACDRRVRHRARKRRKGIERSPLFPLSACIER